MDGKIGALLPPLSALERGSQVIHGAPLRMIESPYGAWPYPEFTALCGVEGWGEAGAGREITCRRCLRVMAKRES